MNRQQLIKVIAEKQSLLCVGLDTDINKIPEFLHDAPDPVFEFNKQIIDAVADYAVAYKINTAFYECNGVKGWESMERTLEYISLRAPEAFTIADAKRGDIGNTSAMYARAFFEALSFDSVTVAPYMGSDSVKPFLDFPGKWVILLAATSNPGADDFQTLQDSEGEMLFEKVIKTAFTWADASRMMLVAGATRADRIAKIRSLVPDAFLLVPGVGAQGGSLEEVVKAGLNQDYGLLINASRSILYASSGDDFAEAAGREARALQMQMKKAVFSGK